MTVNIPLGFAQGIFVFTLSGKQEPMAVTMGWDLTESVTSVDADAQAIYNQLTSANRPFAAGSMNSSYQFEGVELQKATATGPIVGSHRSPVVGLGTNQLLPPNCAVLVKKNTARGGRKGRGRMFVPMAVIGEGFVDQLGTLTAANVIQQQNAWQAFLGATASMLQKPVLFHADPLIDPDPITSFTVTNLISTQRRRLR